jgi:DNA-binding XRE family transcriptional regulator
MLPPFKTGHHLTAARTLAGLTQKQLAALAVLHVNSIKRIERMATVMPSWAVEKVESALLSKGIACQVSPIVSITLQIVPSDQFQDHYARMRVLKLQSSIGPSAQFLEAIRGAAHHGSIALV